MVSTGSHDMTPTMMRRFGYLLGLSLGPWIAASVLAAEEPRCAVLEVFLKGDSERSVAAKEFIEKTYRDRTGLKIAFRDVAENSKDLDRFYKLADHFKVEKPGLPAFYVSGRFEVGWDAQTTPKRLEECLTVEVFLRDGCPRCAAAKPVIFDQIAPRYPGYKFVRKEITTSTENANRLQELAQRYGVAAASVPALHYCGQLKVGFIDAATNHRQWDDVLKAVTVECPQKKTSDVRPGWHATGFRVAELAKSSDITGKGTEVWATSATGGGVPVWMVALLLAAPPAPELDSDEPPPRQTTVVDEADSDADADTPPPRRETPDELPPETDPLAIAPPTSTENKESMTVPWLGELRWRDWGMPAFTIVVGLVDGFNPCAMWVLLFLLSLLVNLRDRWKILAVAGTFVLISGLAYLAFMCGWLQVMRYANQLKIAQRILGTLGIIVGAIHIKDFFAFKKGVSLSIPESAKPELYDRMRRIVMAESLWGAIAGASVLAVLINFIELLCTAGLPALYIGILELQDYPPWQEFAFILLYIAAYMFDDSIMVAIAVVTLGKHKLQERGGRMLKLLGGVVIAGLGVVMIVKPDWLAAVG
jgi:hypothetical protein